MVFPDIIRNDLNFSGYAEPIYSFLNRSARDSSCRIRELIEAWFRHVPRVEQTDLLPRLTSCDDQELISAFFELYSFELLICLGYSLRIHPSINPKLSKKPDFFVQGYNEEFILESVIANGFSKKIRKSQSFVNLTFDKVDEIYSKDFLIDIKIRGNADSPLPSLRIKREIQDWANSLNYEEIKGIYYSEDGKNAIPFKVFEYNGVKLIAKPIPRNMQRGKPGRLIGSRMEGYNEINTKEAIRRAIKKKTSRYGTLEIPYILSINVISAFCDTDDVIDALFGTEQFTFNIDELNATPVPSRAMDGAWFMKGTRLSGVLIIKNINPWTIAQRNVTLYLNPWASHPYNGELRQLPHVDINSDGRICSYSGKDIRVILGLPECWPENI